MDIGKGSTEGEGYARCLSDVFQASPYHPENVSGTA